MKYKDPITGEIKDIYVKTLDNLPVGAIVDYDGDTVPDGYELVKDYSTEEQVIGTWIDGRPLYRRVIETTTPSSTDITYAIATLSSECRIRLYNGYVYDGGQVLPLNLYLGSENFYYSYGYINEYRMKLANTNRVDKTCVLILDYIKTTDSVATTSLETEEEV